MIASKDLLSNSNSPKAGQRVAARIEAEIRELGWPVGQMLGNEADLIARHHVSRAVMREAIRQLEQRGIVEMRRGRGGGLVVAAPVEGAVVRALTTYFEAINVSLKEILEAQLVLEIEAAALAARRIDDAGIATLRSLAAQLPPPVGIVQIDAAPHTEIRAQIARVAGNPALALFIRSLNMSTVDMRSMLVGPAMEFRYRERVEGSVAKKKALIEAIVSGNAANAQYIVAQDAAEQRMLFELFAKSGVRRGDVKSVLRASEPADENKLSQVVMLKLAQDVANLEAPAGSRIGSEQDMIERYGVSRAIFREALRPLEQHGIVRMRRGPKGGLFVGQADPSGTVTMAIDYFQFMGLPRHELFPIECALQLEAIELAASKASDYQLARLRSILESERASNNALSPAAFMQFHTELVEMSGNRVMTLLIRILREMNKSPNFKQRGLSERLLDNHERLLEALESRDAAMARRQMAIYLELIDQ